MARRSLQRWDCARRRRKKGEYSTTPRFNEGQISGGPEWLRGSGQGQGERGGELRQGKDQNDKQLKKRTSAHHCLSGPGLPYRQNWVQTSTAQAELKEGAKKN